MSRTHEENCRSIAGKRIFVGPHEIAGLTSRIAKALSGAGARVHYFNAHEHVFNPPVEETKQLKQLLKRGTRAVLYLRCHGPLTRVLAYVLTEICRLVAFVFICFRAEICVFVGGRGLLGLPFEYPLLRVLGKRVVHVFVGTSSRPRYLSGYAKSVVRDGRVNRRDLRRLARRTKRQARRIRNISRNASIVVENPLCGHFQERPFVNWFKIGVPLNVAEIQNRPRITEATPPRIPGTIRILHCPSRPEIKGSGQIQSTIERLIDEGLPLEFRTLTGIPHGQILHELASCDFAVDALYSDSPLAGFAAEASAFGKAVIVGGYGWDLLPEMLQPEEIPPTVFCHPDELAEAVRKLASDSKLRDECGSKAQEFLETHWEENAFAERFARIVVGDCPDDWFVQPEQVQYTHGLGLTENEARRLVGALIERFGPRSLQVDHVSDLRDRLMSFAKGNPGIAESRAGHYSEYGAPASIKI